MDRGQLIYGLVTACEWDSEGNPIKVKVCTDNEVDYFVVENELGKQLLTHLRSWVQLKGQVIRKDPTNIIDIKEISSNRST